MQIVEDGKKGASGALTYYKNECILKRFKGGRRLFYSHVILGDGKWTRGASA